MSEEVFEKKRSYKCGVLTLGIFIFVITILAYIYSQVEGILGVELMF